MSQDQILLTSSDIPHSKIEHQFGIVDSQIVIGANIFRDVFSSFRDIFGGETKGYKKELNKMKNAAFSEIKKQAKEYGANAIIGLRIDLDEVSGGGKSMFMINAYGSAVKLEKSILAKEQETNTIDEISLEDIQYHKEKNAIKNKINNADEVVEEVKLDRISQYDLWDSDTSLSVLEYSETINNVGRIYRDLESNLSEIPIKYIEDFLKDSIHKINSHYWKLILKDLDERDCFNYSFLNELLRDSNYIKRFRALRLCVLKKSLYQKEEVEKLIDLGNFLESEFDTSVDSREVSKMIGSKKVFKCPYCLRDRQLEKQSCECGRNKFGFKASGNTPNSIAEYLLQRADAMKSAFSEYN